MAAPPLRTSSVPPSSTRVLVAVCPLSTSRRPPFSSTTLSALPATTENAPGRFVPVTVAAVLVTSAPPVFWVTSDASPPAFTCSFPFWLMVVCAAVPPSLITCQPPPLVNYRVQRKSVFVHILVSSLQPGVMCLSVYRLVTAGVNEGVPCHPRRPDNLPSHFC